MMPWSESSNQEEPAMTFPIRDTAPRVMHELAAIRRPLMLLRTARHGTVDYNRAADLKRILRVPATPRPGLATVQMLIDLEARHEELRTRAPQEGGDPWRAARHIEVLIALIAEAQLATAGLRTVPQG
jgi:hypothetical protein